MELSDPINTVKGIGEKSTKNFAKLGIYTILDLLEHYPKGYEVYMLPQPINEIKEGEVVSIQASLAAMAEVKKIKNLQIITCRVQDPTGQIKLTWFNQAYLKNTLRRGYRYIFRGKAVKKNNELVLEQPKIFKQEEYQKLLRVIQPIYPLTEGLTNHAISKAVEQVLYLVNQGEDFLPKRIQKEYHLLKRKYAVAEIHFPKSRETAMDARKRLVFDEFFLFSIALLKLKETKNIQKNCFSIEERKECNQLLAQLPYELTNAQKKVWAEIKADITQAKTMNRLIQGDVGSGKTILAILALYLISLNGYQGCFMVPTEVLAKQHYEELCSLLENKGIHICLLTGSMTAAAKRKAYQLIKEHEVDIIVGTHALIQESVVYDKLALVITDEQHRFGVKQRETLSKKGEYPHVLVMSATPIPRTLAIILYGDLDISVLDELPANRLPIKNCVVDTNYRKKAYQFIERQVLEGRQAYVICPMVEESENIEAENVLEYTERLKEEFSSDIAVEYLHGKMRPAQKNEIMEQFSSGKIKVLVSTTVVEVGVNVPNATVMMVENAERFGLAQLHQLRGRVGRGKYQSYCILVSGLANKETMERLEILNCSNDGFFIANEDLKLRGPGDLFGIRQSGELEFKLGDIYHDCTILIEANKAVKSLTKLEYQEILENCNALKERIESLCINGL